MVLAIVGNASCSDDFLDENLTTKKSTQFFETSEGIESLTATLYANIRWLFGYEYAYGIVLYGIDEFTNGNDLTNEPWNVYDNRFSPIACTTALGAANKNCTAPGALWDELYYGIASANTVIANANLISDEKTRNLCLAQAHFLRGYNYYRLTAQYGGVVLQLEPAAGVVRNFTRSSEWDCWGQVIDDLRKACEYFNTDPTNGNYRYGKGVTWTKGTASHFLAKALLFRASERVQKHCKEWTEAQAQADLKEAIDACTYTIQERGGKLTDNYSDLYANWDGVDCATEMLDEILMAASFDSTDPQGGTAGRFGNMTSAYFSCQFSKIGGKWITRGEWSNKDFQRCRPTEYTYAVFDHVNDARMWKTFQTVYGTNNLTKETEGKGVNLGDPAAVFILNSKTDHTYDKYKFGVYVQNPTFKDDEGRLPKWGNTTEMHNGAQEEKGHTVFSDKIGQWVPHASVLYQNGEFVMPKFLGGDDNPKICNFFAGINKTLDGSSLKDNSYSHRDVTIARLGETFLLRAECYARLGDYGNAMADINVVRRRAQWQEGENRSYYRDGRQAYEKNAEHSDKSLKNYKNFTLLMNTYYLSNPGLAETNAASDLQLKSFPDNLPAEDEAILAQLGVSDAKDRAIHFILNERTRELLGEWQRWETLSRTETLITRTKKFNPEAAANITAGKHEYRPIPQAFIDGLLNNDGSNLSAEQQAAWQNPGY